MLDRLTNPVSIFFAVAALRPIVVRWKLNLQLIAHDVTLIYMLHIGLAGLRKYKILRIFSFIFTFFFTKESLYDIVDIC
jgi:hypothetical protein